uniref:Laccase-2 (Diphenol oxidase 2) (Urishiol oxidase 2)) n=1 Tax=Ganoderma boninense TaxID=34458 RepID=A0A5K1K0T4_9APHY|nr:Laccase-2 (EC (Benzenediol:oxygen oxidoreductase 2) (Diphenol oxidase 2) (Urishiol oxidase 2) [Ganoderma boninense]
MTSSSASCSSLRALHLTVGKVGPAAAAALVSLLSELRMQPSARFTSLDFDGYTEGLLESSPDLPGAFVGLTTLKTLRIDQARTLGADMVLNMKSSLVSADLGLDVILDGVPTLEQRCMSNPIFLLQGSQDTLEKLKASWVLTDDNVSYRIRYPRVRELDLDCLDIPLTYDFVRAFPNTSTLSVSSMRFSGDSDMPEVTRYRNANKREQDEYGTWQALDVVTCSLLDAYLVALRCPVTTLQLSLNGTGESQEWCARMLGAVLDDVHPKVLRLRMGSPRILLRPSLLSALRVERKRQLETLAITYEVTVRDTAFIVKEALVWILQELMPVPITTLELEIDCEEAYAGTPDLDADEQYRYLGRSGGDYFVDLDLRDLAREFMAFIETVTVVRICLRGHRVRKDASVMREFDPGEDEARAERTSEVYEENEDDERSGKGEEHVVDQSLCEPESSQQEVERMLSVED